MPASLTRFGTKTLRHLCPRNLRFGSSSHSPNETTFRRETARIVKSGPATGFTTTAMTRSPLARSSGTTSAGFQPRSLALSRSRSSTRSLPWFATPTVWGGRKRTTTSSNSFSSRCACLTGHHSRRPSRHDLSIYPGSISSAPATLARSSLLRPNRLAFATLEP